MVDVIQFVLLAAGAGYFWHALAGLKREVAALTLKRERLENVLAAMVPKKAPGIGLHQT